MNRNKNDNNINRFLLGNRIDIQSKMSTIAQNNILAYGISTCRGVNQLKNLHHLGIHLGSIKNFMIV